MTTGPVAPYTMRDGFLAGLGLFCGFMFLLEAAMAQPAPAIPSGRIERGTGTIACKITLLPDKQTGDGAPKLVVTVGRQGSAGAFAILAEPSSGLGRVQFVFQNERSFLAPVAMRPARAVQLSTLWRQLQRHQRSGMPFFLTAQSSDGTWVSSRYEDVDPMGLVRLMEQNCGFRSEALTSRTPEELRAEERTLGLSNDQMVQIRWFLTQRFGPANARPDFSSELSDTERGYLRRFGESIGEGPSRYLNRRLADRILREGFVAERKSYAGVRNVQRTRDWVSFTDLSNERCSIESEAISWVGESFYARPVMLFFADASDGRDLMGIDMVRPNPFNPNNSISAIVDGRRFALQADAGRFIKPVVSGDGLDPAVVKAIRAGREITITGTSARAPRPLSITFSAYGFLASFRQMMSNCRRMGLAVWIQ